MSNTLTETIVRSQPVEPVALARPRWRRWANILVLFLAALWIADTAISLAIQHTSLQHRITARLDAAFGRSVEVGSYRFSLWGRPTLEARSVTVSEDPRFGQEYFLRADSLTMSLRWRSLLRGRLEFGGIWLGHPSLNLVRNPDGDWNVAEWLPQFSVASGSRAAAPKFLSGSNALRFSRIHVDSGRINFKRAQEKLPFALVGVTGYVEPEGNGEWRLDLQAAPARAAVILQQAGMLHLSGRVGGTSSRLRPATLDFAWTDASLSDVLRLVRATDYGVRGNLAIVLKASTEAQDWNLESRAEIRQVHRWNLPLRADNPSLNLLAQGILDPELARFDVVSSTLETPRSNAQATGAVSWNQPYFVGQVAPRFIPPKNSESDTSLTTLQIASSAIDASDLFAWARAFRSGISDDITVRGFAKLKASLAGWPLRINEGTLSLGETDLTAKTLIVPVHLASASLLYDSKGAFMSPATISFGAAGGALRVETQGPIGLAVKSGSPGLRSISLAQAASGLHISGGLADVGNLISTARLLGWDISRGWDLTGPVRGDLRWQGSPYPWKSLPTGSLDFGAPVNTVASAEANTKTSGDSLRAPFLNLPVEQIRAHVDLKGAARHVALTSVEAFGAHWTGSLDRRETDPVQAFQVLEEQPSAEQPQQNRWQFALSADRLSAADADRWLNPRWRQSFIDRVLPFLNSRPPAAAQPDNVLATGKINVDQFALAPLVLRRIQTDATIEGRRLAFSNIRAQLAKGDLTGSLRADLEASPSYRVNLDYAGVDLYVLTAATSSLADRFAGVASGKISISATGASRSDLISSLQCRGASRIAGAELMSIDLSTSFADGAFRPGHATFRDVSADFTCDSGKIEFQRLRLSGPTEGFTGQGTADFSRNIDFKFVALSDSVALHAARASDSPSPSYRLTGDLSEPTVSRVKQASARH